MLPGTVLASPVVAVVTVEFCSCTGQIDFPMMRIDVTTLFWKAVEINDKGTGPSISSSHQARERALAMFILPSKRQLRHLVPAIEDVLIR